MSGAFYKRALENGFFGFNVINGVPGSMTTDDALTILNTIKTKMPAEYMADALEVLDIVIQNNHSDGMVADCLKQVREAMA